MPGVNESLPEFSVTTDMKPAEVNSLVEQMEMLTSWVSLESTLSARELNGSISMTLSLRANMTPERARHLLSFIVEIIANGS